MPNNRDTAREQRKGAAELASMLGTKSRLALCNGACRCRLFPQLAVR